MGEIVHTSRIRIEREKGPTRKATIEGFDEPVYYGVHGGIKHFYKVEKGFRYLKEINTVYYDPAVITIREMETALKKAGTYTGTVE